MFLLPPGWNLKDGFLQSLYLDIYVKSFCSGKTTISQIYWMM